MKIDIRGMNLRTAARAVVAGLRRVRTPTHVFLCVADHFEPDWQAASDDLQRERVARWVDGYQRSVNGLSDSRGRPPQHTFFFPIECYRAEHLEALAKLTRAGLGDVEVHLHHDNDSADRLREFLCRSTSMLNDRHGLLRKDQLGQIRYGFIHGNWALDNSHPEGRWCGVNNELTILRETGCYADFTLPAAPSAAQTQTINSIYYAIDDPCLPKSHDRGIAARVQRRPPAESLLMIQGPLLIYQQELMSKPRLENGDITGLQIPTLERFQNWLRAGVGVQGQRNWAFIKLHTHGAQEKNTAVWLGPTMRHFHESLSAEAHRRGFQYFYVTAYEMSRLVEQAERAHTEPDFDVIHAMVDR